MTLWQLKAFATVAREGGFTKAGKILQTTQPAVSALIIDLQNELGVKLFERLGVKTHLTEAGRRLLQIVDNALAVIDKIPEEMEEVKGLKKGRIRVGGSVLPAASFLSLAVQAFRNEHPELDVVLKVDRSGGLEKMLLEGELDVAFMGSAPQSPLIVAEPFREEEVVVIASPDHAFTKKRSVPLKLLATSQLVCAGRLPLKTGFLREVVEQEFVKRGLSFVPLLQVNRDIGSRDVVKGAVASGLAIAFISKCHVLSDARAGRIKILKVPEINLKRTVYLSVHRDRCGSSLIQCFNDFVKRY